MDAGPREIMGLPISLSIPLLEKVFLDCQSLELSSPVILEHQIQSELVVLAESFVGSISAEIMCRMPQTVLHSSS